MIRTALRRLGPLALLLALLGGCAKGDQPEPTLVFVNDCSRSIVMVGVETERSSGGARNADGSPLARGDSLALDCAAWPAEVTVFGDLNGTEPLASVTVPEEPRADNTDSGMGTWYVIAQDGPDGLTLTLSLNRDRKGLEEQVRTAGKNLGLDLSPAAAVFCRSPGHGFQGDGSDLLALRVSPAEGETLTAAMDGAEGWHTGPLAENMAAALRELVEWGGFEFDWENLPAGSRWYFRDEHSQAVDRYDPSGLFARPSFDFVLGLWDPEGRTLVFYELHT